MALARSDTGSDTTIAPRRKWPVFLVGCHRSGTTLLRYLIDAHPDIACPPESKFIAGMHAFVSYPQALRALQSYGIEPSLVFDTLRELVTSVFERVRAREGKRRWVDKTPNYCLLLPFLDTLFAHEVLFVGLVRHPFDTVDSLQRMPAFATEQPEDPDVANAVRRFGHTRAGWARYWLEMNTLLTTFAEGAPDRCRICRYEELVSNPEGVLGDVLTFIDEVPVEGQCQLAFSRLKHGGYQDPKCLESRRVYTSSVGKWHDWPAVERMTLWSIVGQLAESYGYTNNEPELSQAL